MRRTLAAALVVLTTAGLSCSSESSSSAGSDLCTQVEVTQTAWTQLTSINIIEDGTDAFVASLNELKASLAGLAEAAESDLTDEVATLEGAVADLEAAVGEGAGDPTATVAAIGTSLTALATSAQALADAATACS